MGPRYVVVSDVDGTLTGDDEALRRFAAWHAANQDRFALVYASGRTRESLARLIDETPLPVPDAVVAAVGTEVYDHAGTPWPGWTERFAGWDADRVRDVLSGLDGLSPQPASAQTRLKASFDAPALDRSALGAVRRALGAAGIVGVIVYSAALHLDVIPPGAGKGKAARALVRRWGVRSRDVLAFGDSGNDLQLLRAGFRGTIVANALPELVEGVGPGIYQSPYPFAAGVLDGVRHWLRGSAHPAICSVDCGATTTA